MADALNKVRQFRNRINHNEPICFNRTNIDFTIAEDVYNTIQEIFAWIDRDLLSWVQDIDNVLHAINVAKAV